MYGVLYAACFMFIILYQVYKLYFEIKILTGCLF